MTDEHDDRGGDMDARDTAGVPRVDDQNSPGAFDDDRLLACALGLDDDPELLAAAEDDADLAARLGAMRTDVAAVGAQVVAAVPDPDEAYADLAAERWSALTAFFESPPSASRPRRSGRWWRIAAPVAAVLVLAFAVGIVAVDRGTRPVPTGAESATVTGSGASEAAEPAADRAYGSTSTVERFADQLDRFAVVVLARAHAARGILQRFAVVRILKGKAPTMVELVVDGKPADRGRLHLLMLDPVATGAKESMAPQALGGQPSIIEGDDDAPGTALNVAYTYHGRPTVVREFVAGTDPDQVVIPIP